MAGTGNTGDNTIPCSILFCEPPLHTLKKGTASHAGLKTACQYPYTVCFHLICSMYTRKLILMILGVGKAEKGGEKWDWKKNITDYLWGEVSDLHYHPQKNHFIRMLTSADHEVNQGTLLWAPGIHECDDNAAQQTVTRLTLSVCVRPLNRIHSSSFYMWRILSLPSLHGSKTGSGSLTYTSLLLPAVSLFHIPNTLPTHSILSFLSLPLSGRPVSLPTHRLHRL